MPKSRRALSEIVPDAKRMLSALQAASFLNYNPVSFRRLVSQGKIEPRGRIGHYLVFAKEDLQHFQLTDVWARKKLPPALAAADQATAGSLKHKKPYATVTVETRTGNVDFEKIKDFNWADIPCITERVKNKFQTANFKVTVEMPSGDEYTVHFSPQLYSFAPDRLGVIVAENQKNSPKRRK